MRTFCKELKRKGRTCLTFESYAPDETRYRTDLAAWLTSLPKPAALFCAWDSCAITAATVCSECRISIPEQISILGVDDDEFLCNLVSPPLSSIRPDFEGEGFLAAKMLDQMMNSKGMTRPKLMSCKVDGVTERGSTHPLSPSGFLVQRALDFIDDNVCRGITVPDVVDHLGVSRSLLSLRFRQIQRESILQTIRTRRMREVKRLLSSTAYPIARIISMCGFRSESRPKNLFRKMFGMTMSEYRRQHHAETAKHTFR
jgi:LacI family transcriptional regulator